MRRAVDGQTADPARKLEATFDFLAAWFRTETFRGCPFISAAREYGERTNPVFQASVTHKRLVLAYFEELAYAAGYADPKRLAQEINLLHEGATAVAHITGSIEPAGTAKTMAARLIEAGHTARVEEPA
jgi:hypothetical protein